MATIDLDISLLKQSTQGRAGTPDGNVFFDVATGNLEIITVEELPTVDFGGGAVANPLSNQDGVTMRALYAFERQERKVDEVLRQYDVYFRGSFKFAGAYEAVNGRKFASNDRAKIRSSGWIERSATGAQDRIYFGVRSLGNIEPTSQPSYQLVDGGPPVDFAKPGPINEAIQVFGSTANGDAAAGDFDSRTYLAVSVRTFGFNFDRKTLADSGVTEMGGFSTGFALGEAPHLTSGAYTLADVYGGAQVAPWTGTTFEGLGAPQVETGFNEADGNFSFIMNNTNGASLDEIVAFFDALSQTDDDIDTGTGTINGARVDTYYTYDAQGRVVFADGVFVEGLPAADEQSVVFVDDGGNTKTRPFNVQLVISTGPNAVADPNAWWHAFYKDGTGSDDFNQATAVTVNDSTGTPMKGPVSGQAQISVGYAFDQNTQAGLPAGVDKDIVVEVEGDGIATQAKTEVTITRTSIVPVTCSPALETNL